MSETPVNNAVTFLEGLAVIHPNILIELNRKQLLALDVDPTTPFEGERLNEDFLLLTEAYFLTKYTIDATTTALRSALLEPQRVNKQVDVESEKKVITCQNEVAARLKTIWDTKLKLARRYKFSDKETLVLVYVFTCQAADQQSSITWRSSPFGGGGGLSFGQDTISMCKACDIKISEMLEFLNADREHMQQGIFPDVQQSFLLRSAITLDECSCRALLGVALKGNERLKIDQTRLAEILAEEEGAPSGEGALQETEPTTSGEASSHEGGDGGKVGVDNQEEVRGEMAVEEQGLEGSVQPQEPQAEEITDLDMLLKREREMERLRKEGETQDPPTGEEALETESTDKLTPYKTDLEYLDDHFQLIAQKIRVKSMESTMEMDAQYNDEFRDTRMIRQKRESEGKLKVLEKKCEKRLNLTKAAGSWIPRLERMVESRGLCMFEKNILLTLIGFVIQPNKASVTGSGMFFGAAQTGFTIGELLRLFCTSLQDQIKHRTYFYKSATLVQEGMLVVNNAGLTGDPASAKVEIDRRMLDFCVGLDTEFSEIVEGSHLYYPKTKFEQVVLGKEQKSLIFSTVSNFESFKRCRKRMGLDDAITYGAGMVMLFHGSPGTGKTMMANALANKLGKEGWPHLSPGLGDPFVWCAQVLLINFPSLGSMTAGENFKFIFREAKINDAILFFDECEAIFETREKGGHDVNTLLTEIERHDGLIIMATNRPYDLDEAMHRRIMIAIEFRQPDHILRKSIWESHIPETMKLDSSVDLNELALRFELAGGFIKNAVLSALSIAVSRDGDNPVILQQDLLQGANLQLRGRLRMKDFHRRVVPSCGLDKIIVPDDLIKTLREIVQFEKARQVSILFGQWGFGADGEQGITVLLHGAPGTGKSKAAEALGYEVVNCAELLSKWVGESTKNIDAIFEEARHSDAILVFDEAEGLFGSRTEMSTSTDRYANVDVGVLLYHIERFPGIIILTTNLIDNIDKAFFRRLKFVLHFDVPPFKLRAKLWRLLIPEETPLAADVDFEKLAHFEMSGGNIKSAVFRAASRAALRLDQNRVLTMRDLEESAEEESGKNSTRTSFRRQDSATRGVYS
ncbi:hypothetical protein EMCRGX_G034692 [Ephydatia muelleri]